MTAPHKIIALDFGLKRTGIAITDETQRIATGLTTVASERLMSFLIDLVSKEKIATIVLGMPKNLNGTPTNITPNILLLKEALQQQFPRISIVLHDERFTSKIAVETMINSGAKKQQRQNKATIDKISATIILQSFLSHKGN